MINRFAIALASGVALFSHSTGAKAQLPRATACVLSVQETSGQLGIVSSGGAMMATIPISERPHEIAVTLNGKTAYVSQFGITDYDSRLGTPGDRVAEIDLLSARRVADFILPPSARGPHGVKLRPATSELFVNAEAGGYVMFVFDTRTRRLLRSFPLPNATHNFVFSADGKSLYSFAGANGASRIDPDDGSVLAQRDVGSPIRGLFLTKAGAILASAKGALFTLDPGDLGVVQRLEAPRPGQYIYAEQWPDGMIVAPSPSDGGIALFPANGGPPQFVATGKSPILVRRGPDNLIYVSNAEDDHISVLGLRGDNILTLKGLSGPNGLGFGRCPASAGGGR
ncbi:YncE family protein [Novosphingobium sp. PASSN1]|uniref:YncE family protein n=1 Tax=Novosphingobium sp. PASSN1 TaxID=2015561 RepID=UPI0025D6298B|nr:YncE family protein [Novosphingobium sp. PASSN1]